MRYIVIFALLMVACTQTVDVSDLGNDHITLCEESGGDWQEFQNSCVDSCAFQRGEVGTCDVGLTEGCYCGPGRCWNGDACVSI